MNIQAIDLLDIDLCFAGAISGISFASLCLKLFFSRGSRKATTDPAQVNNPHLDLVRRRAHRAAPAGLALTDFDRADLANSRLFANAEPDVIDSLLSGCSVVPVGIGQLLISDHESSNALYFVLEGRMKVYVDSDRDRADKLIEAGDYIGEISLIDNRPVCADVVADTDSRVLVIDRDTFWKLIRASHAVACNLLATIGGRLHHQRKS